VKSASEILSDLAVDNRALLYRCRWSQNDADRIVPQLIRILYDHEDTIVHDALRSLFTIGAPAVRAAASVVPLTTSMNQMTRQLAVLTLGQIAHHKPEVSVGPVAKALQDAECRQDALRILAFIGSYAKEALSDVISCYESVDAKTRKLALKGALSIDSCATGTQELIEKAKRDRSKIVRDVISKMSTR
jgi:hypothetical protein